jgi:uncharacterized protein with FMN-binding domain
MKTSRFMLVAGASAAMIAAGWRVGAAPVPDLVASDGAAGGITSDPAASPTPAVSPSMTPDPQPPAGPSGTFVGAAVRTAYGTMQVQIVVSDGTITDIQPLVIGLGDSTSRRINANAVPILELRVLAAQSASVSYVSGASYTSSGYLASVADAMASAGI